MIAADVTNSGPADPSGLPQRGAPQAQSPGYAGLMQGTLWGFDADRLERSCSRRPDSIRFGTGTLGLERAEVSLSGAFEPHRHDTYAIGITTAGVQTFRYRGSRRVCLPGQLHILHPDEAHDGAAGTEDGFSYRIIYIAPELIRQALDGDALPFVANPVQPPTSTTRHVASFLESIDEPTPSAGLAAGPTPGGPGSATEPANSGATTPRATQASRPPPPPPRRSPGPARS